MRTRVGIFAICTASRYDFSFDQCIVQFFKRCSTLNSYSPIHLLVRDEAEILKKVDFDWEAMHFPINVFPVPKQQIVNSFSSCLNYIKSTKIIRMQSEATVQLERN